MPRTREAQREYRRQRYATYHQLCESRGIEPRSTRWWAHFRELNDGREPRLTKAEIFAWWRERFTDDELHRMASAIDFLLREAA